MRQYLELLQTIKEKGTYKPAAREGMPGTLSLFGYQLRHNLSEGFPLLTTKKIYWKGVVHELIWFLRGDTNIKYLVENGVNIWNEDAYNYYTKVVASELGLTPEDGKYHPMPMNVWLTKLGNTSSNLDDYIYGDCGYQYGRVWRDWQTPDEDHRGSIDQITNVFDSLKNNPESRRHIITAIDPVNDTNLALYWCHAMFQFNCRPLTLNERISIFMRAEFEVIGASTEQKHKIMDDYNIPRYYLDCQLYQRSADVVLGVPFNIASYALLTHIFAKLLNMIPGEFVHTFGDVHIYDNHMDAVEEQLKRTPTVLPKLHWNTEAAFENRPDIEAFIDGFEFEDLFLQDYNPQASIKAELSTGLKK